jgi:hypothetical protein
MTSQKSSINPLSEVEKQEMKALKDAINHYPASVHPAKMEKYVEYLVRSLSV